MLRSHAQLTASALSAALALLTAAYHNWIEILFHLDPDAGSGLLEWGLVVVLALAALLFAYLAIRASTPATAG